ncbi:MAG: 2-dehydro-3-deoxygalactonokinase [Paracoccaceae bacterium]|tara:strand:- start:6452 stop:7378 length:927 start_codon:yes stop_codon:yes gene_type:complete
MTDTGTSPAHWAAVDWGTTHLRLWVLDHDHKVIRQTKTEQGMTQLHPTEYEATLLDLLSQELQPNRAMGVICCGMVGSRQGWQEVPYAPCPTLPPSGERASRVTTKDPRIEVYLLPGIKQISPPDVMRGEETQIAGFLSRNPQYDGVLCLPGTHSKWVHISAGEVVSFQTFMTGELFALLCKESVLRHNIGATGWNDEMFTNAIDDAISRPAAIAAKLFALRAQSLIATLPPEAARARLSGLLIGLELAAARPYWLGAQVAVLGDTEVAQAYCTALTAQGSPVTVTSTERMTLDGLKSAYTALQEMTK